MAKRGKAIVTCAVTGSIHVPSQTPHLPVTPEQIADAAIGAADAGAAIVHLHARDPKTGEPTPDPDVFARFLPAVKARSNVVINVTTGGGHGMTLEERTRAARTFKPELCSLNMGSMNFGLFPLLDRVERFKHPWEPRYLEMTRDFIFRNTFKDVETIVSEFAAQGTRFEFECYDVGHLYNLAHFADRGLVEPPLFVQTIFGILGGIGPEPENVMHMKATADRLFWPAAHLRRHRCDVVAQQRREPPSGGDVAVQRMALVLGQHHDPPVTRIDEVRQREVDQPVVAAERHSRLGTVERERREALALPAGQDDRQDVGVVSSVIVSPLAPM